MDGAITGDKTMRKDNFFDYVGFVIVAVVVGLLLMIDITGGF